MGQVDIVVTLCGSKTARPNQRNQLRVVWMQAPGLSSSIPGVVRAEFLIWGHCPNAKLLVYFVEYHNTTPRRTEAMTSPKTRTENDDLCALRIRLAEIKVAINCLERLRQLRNSRPISDN